MTRIFELTGFQRDLLYVIAGADRPSGQAVRREMEKHAGDVTHGRLYPNLDSLVEYGLVEKGPIDKRTNAYVLTTAGAQAIERRQRWEQQYVAPLGALSTGPAAGSAGGTPIETGEEDRSK